MVEKDIVERLRGKYAVVENDNTLCDEAADEIERLRLKLEFYRMCYPWDHPLGPEQQPSKT